MVKTRKLARKAADCALLNAVLQAGPRIHQLPRLYAVASARPPLVDSIRIPSDAVSSVGRATHDVAGALLGGNPPS